MAVGRTDRGRWGLSVAVWGAVLATLASTRADPDLWGHVRYGMDIWLSRRLPSVDPYSFTQDVPWVNHEWLSELQMGLAWLAGGTAGLALLKGALVTAAFALAWAALRGTDLAARVGMMLVLTLGSFRLIATIRPQVWTFLALALLCRALIADDRRGRRWLPLLFVVWVNVHGGWIVGLGVLGVWSAVEWWCQRHRRREVATTAGLCAVATLVNPYGWGMWHFIGDTVRLGRDITEWQPLWTAPPLIWVPWLSALALGVWGASRRDAMGLATGGVLAMLAYASIRVERLAPLFVLSAVVLAAPAIRERWPSMAERAVGTGSRRQLLAAALAVAVLVAAAPIARRSLGCIEVGGPWAPDRAIARRLDAASPGRLVVFFDWGQYALWHWGPALKVSMDGRRETIYSDARLAEHAAILDGTRPGLDVLAAWQAEYVWLPERHGATRAWLAGNGYSIESTDAQAFLAVRHDLPPLSTAGRSDRTVRRCFPE